MRPVQLKTALLKSTLAASVLLLGNATAFGQQVINLAAGPSTATLPDGSQVPMWGYSCGAPGVDADGSASTATCAPLKPNAAGSWSPVVITVPTGQALQINLTNNLSFQTGGSTANNIPTSLTVVGQLGGGLGDTKQRTTAPSPIHVPQGASWFISGDTNGANFTPPAQLDRVQSFATEVNVAGVTPTTAAQPCPIVAPATSPPAGCAALTWTNLRPGTYLIESGTHPSIQAPMGLYGILVVTTAPGTTSSGCAYPDPKSTSGGCLTAAQYAAEVPLLFSEIDPVQNTAVQTAVTTAGFSETAVNVLRSQVTSVVPATDAKGNPIAGSGYSIGNTVVISGGGGTGATAHVSQVDPVTGAIVAVVVDTPGGNYSSTPSASVTQGSGATLGSGAQLSVGLAITANTAAQCSDNQNHSNTPVPACYPPAVNYTPLYYLINGVAFDRTNIGASVFAAAPGTVTAGSNVLVRVVNAGLRMHVPSIVGAQTTTPIATVPTVSNGFALVAEDGNVLPGVARVQSEVFMAAGKTMDLMINAPAAGSALPIYDRELSLSGNAINRDGGMLAYISINGAAAPAVAAGAAGAGAGAAGAGAPAGAGAVAVADTYNALIAGMPFAVTDPSKGVIANDVNVYGVTLLTQATNGTVILGKNGTFTYKPNGGTSSPPGDSFTYCANGTVTGGICSSGITATVTLGASAIADTISCDLSSSPFNSNMATYYVARTPGLLAGCTDTAGLPMTVTGVAGADPKTPMTGTFSGGSGSVTVDQNGGFTATAPSAGTYTFGFIVQNSTGTQTATATATVVFPAATGLAVTVLDTTVKTKPVTITDYRWIIEEDRTFFVDPSCAQNPLPAGCPAISLNNGTSTSTLSTPFNFGTNFHTSSMPVVASGCTGPLSCEQGQTLQGTPAACDIGSGICETTNTQKTPVDPKTVALDPRKRYYISVLPGDAANPFIGGNTSPPANCSQGPYNTDGSLNTACGHGMGGAPIAKGQTAVTVLTVPSPYPAAKLSVFVFEDDYPLDGEHNAGGGVDVLSPEEPGLGGFNIVLSDDAGGTGDATGQPTYDMFNQPLSNALVGTIDPVTGLDACPVSPVVADNVKNGDGTQKGIVGMIVTCPKYESDGTTLSPLAGQAVVANLYQGRYGVAANPGADRIANGEEWVQTNTLDGQKAHDSFMRIGEPGYFQEFGPAGYHVTIGFANPKVINERRSKAVDGTGMCDAAPNGGGLDCSNTVTGLITTARMSRPPDERLYGSGDRTSFAFTQCYVTIGEPDGATFAFTKCNSDGTFTLDHLPAGNWKLTIFDQWNDQIVDGISTPVNLACTGTSAGGSCSANGGTPGSGITLNLGEIASHQWQSNIYTRTFFDTNYNGVSDKDSQGNATEPGLTLVATNNRFRDGSFSNFNNTDLNGFAGYNEIFPLFNWYVIETDTTRYKTTGVHVVYDSGGPVDGSKPPVPDSNGNIVPTPCVGSTVNPCGDSVIGQSLANTYEANPLPADLRLPGAVYCADADCTNKSINPNVTGNGTDNMSASVTCPANTSGGGVTCTPLSTGRIDPPYWFGSYAWQGFSGQNNFIEWGKTPYVAGETGGIHGHVVYASTRPFDDTQLLLQLSWEPLVAHVRVNLYKDGVADDGVTQTLTLIDHTDTTSFDDWVQGFRAGSNTPNISCPGQSTNDPYWFGLENQPQWMDFYKNPATTTALPYNSQFKCYDGMHNWNQVQPAPYDGMYSFPSVTGFDAQGRPSGTNCSPSACTTDPDQNDPYRYGMPMLPPGKYVVEVVVPPGYELVKEEDKNILIGDNFIAPVAVQFPGVGGSVFILPDQAAIGASYNPNNPQNPTQDLGRNLNLVSHEGDTGSVESFWPCVGALREVPDFLSIFPQSGEVAPFAGAMRHLCDRKEVTLTDQSSALAKFYIFSSTHVASHFTGVISDDFTAEFDPYSPQFGEKFGPAYLPVSVKDWTGNEINRVYTDAFGYYNGLNYSTWEVDPPNPTGYGPTMMVMCMNDSGAGTLNPGYYNPSWAAGTDDPFYQPNYSQFCYELPFMPGQTGYFDTPVTPTSAFSEGYNHPDCAYPDSTPTVSSVTSSAIAGPWVQPQFAGTRAAATFTVSGVAPCTNRSCSNPSSITFPHGVVTCTSNGTGGPNCSANSDNGRSSNVASYIRSNIVALMGAAGYTASVSGGGNNPFMVTVTAPPGTASSDNASYNGTPVVTATNHIGNPVPTILLAGGADPADASLVLTINALSDQQVDNYGYSGPAATTDPWNKQKVKRHYGFGGTTGTVGLLGSDGILYPLTVAQGGWTDTQITGTVTTSVTIGGTTHTLPSCSITQQRNYNGLPAQCGELVITTHDGKTSVDTVTVTVGGKKPTVLAAGKTIQSAIDAAQPGDMIIVPPGVYNEMLLMWKPVRLQGVGAASSIVDANTQPAGKLLDPWRRQVNCLFGLTPDGRPNVSDTSCQNGWTAASGGPNFPTMIVDRIPMEGILGWDTTVNGNLAEQLSEPSLMGAYEGAVITVLGKGVNIPALPADTDPGVAWGSGAESAFPAGSVLLTANDCAAYPSNYYCNPSSIDGLGLRDSSQGGGGIYVHAWAHQIQIANNRVYNNTGSLSGGISIGQGEHVDLPLVGDGAPLPPGSCEAGQLNPQGGQVVNEALPYCYNYGVNVHHNAVTLNSSLGDELFSSTPAGAGGVSIANGSDYYHFTNNWVCGNMSTGDGGGVAHIGWSKNGLIEHNTIIFNQSTNPTIATNGGGILVMGAPDPDPTCGANNDKDCVPTPGSVPPSDGTGYGLSINANLVLGNSADSGAGGGIRLQEVNGTDVVNFPGNNGAAAFRNTWNSVSVTNNIIVNNVAGWDGAGISLYDTVNANIVNNTIASNDSTASSGVLATSLFAPLASDKTITNCTVNNGSQSCPQVAGLASNTNSPNFIKNLPGTVNCPTGHPNCKNYSTPLLFNDVFWQNRSFFIGVGGFGTGRNQNMQHTVALFNATPTATPVGDQKTTGACTQYALNSDGTVSSNPVAAAYWDIGVRGDKGPQDHSSGLTLNPTYSVLSDITDYPGTVNGTSTNNSGSPSFVSQYCNGARTPPEAGTPGFVTVNPGTNETNALPNYVYVFNLTPSATVDEGNNWINMRWGPLTLTNPQTGTTLGNYAPGTGSSAINAGASTAQSSVTPPATDYFGNPRTAPYDIGAIETPSPIMHVTPTSLSFGNVLVGSNKQLSVTVSNDPTAPVALILAAPTISAGTGNSQPSKYTITTNTCPIGGSGLTPGAPSCTITVTFAPTAVTSPSTQTATLNVNATNTAAQTVALSGTGAADINFTWSNFGTVGNWGTATGQRTITVHNAFGSALTLTSVPSVTNQTGSEFSRTGGSCVAGTVLVSGGTCTVNVTRTRPAPGAAAGTLTVTYSGAVTGNQTLGLSGN